MAKNWVGKWICNSGLFCAHKNTYMIAKFTRSSKRALLYMNGEALTFQHSFFVMGSTLKSRVG